MLGFAHPVNIRSQAVWPPFPHSRAATPFYGEHSSPKSASAFAHNPTYCKVTHGAGCNPSVHPLARVPLCRISFAMSAIKIDSHGLDMSRGWNECRMLLYCRCTPLNVYGYI